MPAASRSWPTPASKPSRHRHPLQGSAFRDASGPCCIGRPPSRGDGLAQPLPRRRGLGPWSPPSRRTRRLLADSAVNTWSARPAGSGLASPQARTTSATSSLPWVSGLNIPEHCSSIVGGRAPASGSANGVVFITIEDGPNAPRASTGSPRQQTLWLSPDGTAARAGDQGDLACQLGQRSDAAHRR